MRKEVKFFYRSKEWKQTRDAVLKRDAYLCRMCGMPAEEVHHIVRVTDKNVYDPKVTMNPDNLLSLCRNCHFAEHRGEHGGGRKKQEAYGYEFGPDGQLVPKHPPL